MPAFITYEGLSQFPGNGTELMDTGGSGDQEARTVSNPRAILADAWAKQRKAE